MSSNEDPSARRDQEEKETEEVEVGGRAVEGGENEAVGGGGNDPAAGGGGGSVRIGVLGSSTYTDPEVREMLPGRRLEAVAHTWGRLAMFPLASLIVQEEGGRRLGAPPSRCSGGACRARLRGGSPCAFRFAANL